MRNSQANKGKLLIPFCYLTLYIVWGSTYFFIKMAVQTIPAFYVVGFRFASGGILLLSLAYLTRRLKTRPTWKQIGASVFLGILLLIGGNGLVTLAEKKVDSYLAALVVAATPMWVAFFDRVLLKIKISAAKLGGIGVGFIGVAFLLYNGHSLSGSLSPEILMAVGGVASWGLATSLGHKIKTYPDPLVNSGIQMLFVGIICLVGVSVFLPPLPQILPQVSARSAFGAIYLAVIGSLAFVAFTYLIAHEPAVRVTSYALVNPLIATLLGLLVGGETAVPLLALGLPLILAGVTLMLYGESIVPYVKKRILGQGLQN